MSSSEGLVLDANILIRAVLGKRVRSVLEKYQDSAEFYAPDLCFEQAREYLAAILEGQGVDPHPGLAVLDENQASGSARKIASCIRNTSRSRGSG